eukprot:scaffold7028_cov243-Pinguiococcus_pyrenoidosus.AAC.11
MDATSLPATPCESASLNLSVSPKLPPPADRGRSASSVRVQWRPREAFRGVSHLPRNDKSRGLQRLQELGHPCAACPRRAVVEPRIGIREQSSNRAHKEGNDLPAVHEVRADQDVGQRRGPRAALLPVHDFRTHAILVGFGAEV